MSSTLAFPLTVYYDASCPLCAAEMKTMASRDAAARLHLVDCSHADFHGGPAPRQALMTALHAVDAEGRLHVGVAAIRACRKAVGLPAGGFLLDLPPVARLADRAYAALARHRHRLPRPLVALLTRPHTRGGTCADGNCRL